MPTIIKENFRVLWEGRLSLSKIHWKAPMLAEYTHSDLYKEEIRENWLEHKAKYPNDYDGISLYLYDYYFRNSELLLKVGTVHFSTIIYLYNHKIHVNQGYGLIGAQSLIFSPDKSHILVGKRALNQEYFPGALTLPGGIAEVADFMYPASESLMREIHEEVPLEFEPYGGLFSILVGWNPVSVTFLLYNTVKETSKFDLSDVVSDDAKEWEGNLRWINMDALKNMDYTNVINGLYYYKWNISRN
jgi:8-oxo-dGTP pyrophosphatase MutT (NUDIX family)